MAKVGVQLAGWPFLSLVLDNSELSGSGTCFCHWSLVILILLSKSQYFVGRVAELGAGIVSGPP